MKLLENNPQERYLRAKKQVEEMKGFYAHLSIYVIFVFIFIWINYRTTSFPWALFPIVGWGLGVLGHAASTFNFFPFFGRDWEQRKIKEIMDKEESSMNW
ncbi:MAG: 2TM domain-containing protein [Flavobacteriaceae bacterium]|nr:2TM domain-containing protein [Flavobacteriaceae bacterium]